MKNEPILRDERFYAVENASYKIGFTIFTFGLFAVILYRSIFRHEANWDLFALIVIASGAATIYQGVHKVLPFPWKKLVLYMVGVAVLAAITTWILVALK
ncbi:hypothetical protein LARV_03830 [Longilinea arvoryzae]|uniref:Uncharacterized protein n=1 Tax=Longilinea arvoryzae TaxID=360412 RepID=A0A0K8MXQ6_9CHLR|nr:hypothetical protein [Longilinea arvoryzae]GAP16034.1 hypothetical protein LARV_03830 [Longilinea arvoryzae]